MRWRQRREEIETEAIGFYTETVKDRGNRRDRDSSFKQTQKRQYSSLTLSLSQLLLTRTPQSSSLCSSLLRCSSVALRFRERPRPAPEERSSERICHRNLSSMSPASCYYTHSDLLVCFFLLLFRFSSLVSFFRLLSRSLLRLSLYVHLYHTHLFCVSLCYSLQERLSFSKEPIQESLVDMDNPVMNKASTEVARSLFSSVVSFSCLSFLLCFVISLFLISLLFSSSLCILVSSLFLFWCLVSLSLCVLLRYFSCFSLITLSLLSSDLQCHYEVHGRSAH